MSAWVVVFGSLNMDLVAGVKRIAAPGETVPGLSLDRFPGGKGANQALAAHKAWGPGGAVRLFGKLGGDPLGAELLAFYRAEGLAVDGIAVSAAAPTGTALIQVERDSGQNAIVVVPGANADFAPKDMAAVEVREGDILLSQFEVPLDCILALFQRGRNLGAVTLLNPAPAKPIHEALLAAVDIFVLNEPELAVLTGTDVTEDSPDREIEGAARALVSAEGQSVVVTLGPRGALAVREERSYRVPGRPVAAVDTTGAGDCFVGTLAAALAQGRGFEDALATANAAAALSVQRRGAGPSMPTAEEIAAALRGDGR